MQQPPEEASVLDVDRIVRAEQAVGALELLRRWIPPLAEDETAGIRRDDIEDDVGQEGDGEAEKRRPGEALDDVSARRTSLRKRSPPPPEPQDTKGTAQRGWPQLAENRACPALQASVRLLARLPQLSRCGRKATRLVSRTGINCHSPPASSALATRRRTILCSPGTASRSDTATSRVAASEHATRPARLPT